jgi:putative Holliday junction resolvase
MRILGLDYGSKRIGVAISDEMGITAHGIATITRRNRRQVVAEIEKIVRSYQVEKIVLGYPLRFDNTEGIQCEKIKVFSRILSTAFSLPVILQDETLTTKEAEEILRVSNVRKKRRKAVLDQLAAAIILQNYLDSLSPGGKSRVRRQDMVYEDRSPSYET